MSLTTLRRPIRLGAIRLALLVAAIFVVGVGDQALAQSDPPGRYVDLVFDRVARTNDLTYGSAIDKPTGRPVDLKLDIYEPADDAATRRPVFVFLFGGAFVMGNKEQEPRAYCDLMARRG